MGRRLWRFGLLAFCLAMTGCRLKWSHKKPDPAKGVVTGVAICSDTGKPARFASVVLTAAPKKDEKLGDSGVLPAVEETVTDLDGRFRLEAVEPGQYYAYATLEGYLDPRAGIDFKQAMSKPDDRSRALEAIRQWKDHLAEVQVGVHRTSEVVLTLDRGAEIRGTVSFDDGSPAIGMGFHLSRKRSTGEWSEVDAPDSNPGSIDGFSNGHGQYAMTNLSAGEYVVCAMMPTETPEAAPRVCLGDTFRRKNAKTVKVVAGEVLEGVDIAIPLAGLHTVGGRVAVLSDGHAPDAATVHLLYADDREEVRKTGIDPDGSFVFPFVPEDKYLVRVNEAKDTSEKIGGKEHPYAEKEIPLVVKEDVDDLSIQLGEVAPVTPQP